MPYKYFKKSARLKSDKIRHVLRFGKRISSPNILLMFESAQSDFAINSNVYNKLGVIAIKKISQKAWERNKIKRRFREFFRQNQDLFPTPFNYVFRQRTSPTAVTHKAFEREFKQLIKKIK